MSVFVQNNRSCMIFLHRSKIQSRVISLNSCQEGRRDVERRSGYPYNLTFNVIFLTFTVSVQLWQRLLHNVFKTYYSDVTWRTKKVRYRTEILSRVLSLKLILRMKNSCGKNTYYRSHYYRKLLPYSFSLQFDV